MNTIFVHKFKHYIMSNRIVDKHLNFGLLIAYYNRASFLNPFPFFLLNEEYLHFNISIVFKHNIIL